jgi:hypothetical protein
MEYLYSIDAGANIYVWKWVEDHLSQEYLQYKEKKLRKRDNIRNAGKYQVQQEITNEDDGYEKDRTI